MIASFSIEFRAVMRRAATLWTSQKQTHAAQQIKALFDHLSAPATNRGNVEAKLLRRLEVHVGMFGRRMDRSDALHS